MNSIQNRRFENIKFVTMLSKFVMMQVLTKQRVYLACYHEFTMSYLLTYVLIYKHHVWLCPQREWFCKSKQNSLNLSTKKFKTNIIFWIKYINNVFFVYQFSCAHRVTSTLHSIFNWFCIVSICKVPSLCDIHL